MLGDYRKLNRAKWLARHRLKPGDVFPSRDAAALDAGNWARGQGSQRFEWGGTIFRVPGGYSYNGVRGDNSGVNLTKLYYECPAATDVWHTHPDPGNDNPNMNTFSDDDIDVGLLLGIGVYLKTPMGDTKYFDGNTGRRRTVR